MKNPLHFEHGHSVSSEAQIMMHFTCGCRAYQDVFTYGRWQALGHQVERGQKGFCLTTYKAITKENDKGDEYSFTVPKKTYVFCRCQVKEK